MTRSTTQQKAATQNEHYEAATASKVMFTKPWCGHVDAERVSRAGELAAGSDMEGLHHEPGAATGMERTGGARGSVQTRGRPPRLENRPSGVNAPGALSWETQWGTQLPLPRSPSRLTVPGRSPPPAALCQSGFSERGALRRAARGGSAAIIPPERFPPAPAEAGLRHPTPSGDTHTQTHPSRCTRCLLVFP